MLLKFFTVIFYSDGKFIPSHLYLFIKVLIFVILSGFSPFSSWFNATVRAYWKHLFYWWDLLLLFCFCSNQENLYMIHHDWNLLYEIYNAITEYNWIQTHYLSSIPNYFDIFFLRESKSCFITSSASSLIMVSMLSLLHYTFFIIIYGRNEVICNC